MRNKKILLFVILALAIGFAAVTTTLFINGATTYSTNKDDFNVIFTDATPSEENLTGSKVNAKASAKIESDKKHITFSTQDLAVVREWARVDYEITNFSRNYDAAVTVSWTLDNSADQAFYNEYLEIENHQNWTGNIEASTSETGWVKVSVKKAYLGNGDINDPKEISFTVTFDANAVSRESLAGIGVSAKDSSNNNLNARASLIAGSRKNKLLTSLENAGLVDNKNEIDALIEIESDVYEDIKSTTFDVSNIASEGQKLGILHYDESNKEWEYLSVEEVDENNNIIIDFSLNSEIAFVVLKEGNYITKINSFKYVDKVDAVTKEQHFIVPITGIYKLEVWGASGGNSSSDVATAYGGYSTGEVYLEENEKLYINVGQQGIRATSAIGGGATYNGGGSGGNAYKASWIGGSSGGGATHIARVSGVLANLESYKGTEIKNTSEEIITYDSSDILIVAGGGGGVHGWTPYAGSGGGYKGEKAYLNSYSGWVNGADQTSGYQFGLGQNGRHAATSSSGGGEGSNGGGGGWYGGLSYQGNGKYSNSAGSGGSGYIGSSLLSNKIMFMYCKDLSNDNVDDCDQYRSNITEIKTETTSSVSEIPIAEYAKKGNGYARITYLGN